MERLNLQARVSRELPQLEHEFVKVTKLYSLAINFDVHVEPEEMALYQTLMPSFHNLKVGYTFAYVVCYYRRCSWSINPDAFSQFWGAGEACIP